MKVKKKYKRQDHLDLIEIETAAFHGRRVFEKLMAAVLDMSVWVKQTGGGPEQKFKDFQKYGDLLSVYLGAIFEFAERINERNPLKKEESVGEILESMVADGHATKDKLGRYSLTAAGNRFYEKHIATDGQVPRSTPCRKGSLK